MLCGFLFLLLLMCMYMCLLACVHHVYAVPLERQKRASDLVTLEFQTIVNHLMRVLGTELGSSRRAASVLQMSLTTEPTSQSSKMRFHSFVAVCHTEDVDISKYQN